MFKECVICGEPPYSKRAKYCRECFVGIKPSSVESAVVTAIRRGDLKPIKECICVDCGKPAQHYDHRDYNKPLDVAPVCRVCNAARGHAIPYGKTAAGKLISASI